MWVLLYPSDKVCVSYNHCIHVGKLRLLSEIVVIIYRDWTIRQNEIIRYMQFKSRFDYIYVCCPKHVGNITLKTHTEVDY